jgi:transcriptional regulator with XRE-family HTH domain
MDQERILAELLRRLRVRAGLSQEKLGSAAGVNARTISDLERSVTHYPRAGTAYRIADALGLAGAERENWLALATPVHAAATRAPDVVVTGDFAATVLAAAVRELREQRGLSARELGQRAGLSLRTITDIEAGKRQRVHLQNAARLADELRLAGHARERFLRLAEGPTAAEPVPPEEARPGFFGRERELAEVTELLRRSPLVVLTGPGGVGKTTLAEAVLASLDRPRLTLDLTRVPAGEELARAIAVISRFDEDTAAGWVGQLGALLPPDAVLLLDNLEHLRAVPEAVAAIRAAHPGRTVLATSRTLSGLEDGIEYAIGPLPVPAACQVFLDAAGRSGRPLPARVTSALIEEVCVRRAPRGARAARGLSARAGRGARPGVVHRRPADRARRVRPARTPRAGGVRVPDPLGRRARGQPGGPVVALLFSPGPVPARPGRARSATRTWPARSSR